MITLEQGKKLIKLARNSICSMDKEPTISESIKKEFCKKQGIFVTLKENNELRGCIGFPEPTFPLYDAIVKAAKSAAFEDPRFPPLTKDEFDNVEIEISVLTVPELIKVKTPKEYLSKITIGKDGLIIRAGFNSGLLLPIVPVEWKWDVKQFLEYTCEKAGLKHDAWLEPGIELSKFQSQVYKEEKPNGNIIEIM